MKFYKMRSVVVFLVLALLCFLATKLGERRSERSARLVKFYIYDLPSVLNEDLVVEYSGRENRQHSVGYIFFSRLLRNNMTYRFYDETADVEYKIARTFNPNEALILFVPAYFNFWPRGETGDKTRYNRYCNKLKNFLEEQPLWQRKKRNHVFVFGNGGGYLGTAAATLVQQSTILVVDKGNFPLKRPNSNNRNLIAIPYPTHKDLRNKTMHLHENYLKPRSTFVYLRMDTYAPDDFQGSHHLRYLLLEKFSYNRSDPDVLISGKELPYSEMVLPEYNSSTFCLVPAGRTPATRRLYEAILLGCIPVLLSDYFIPPFPNSIDWSTIMVRISEKNYESTVDQLRKIDEKQIQSYRENLYRHWLKFTFQDPPVHGDATHMILKEIVMQLQFSTWKAMADFLMIR